jgi:uncharacterized protein YbaR (Trm112 family)
MDTKLLDLLVCPVTKTKLEYDEKNQELISHTAGLAYPIKSGIPIMLVDEARIVDIEKAALYRSLYEEKDDQ